MFNEIIKNAEKTLSNELHTKTRFELFGSDIHSFLVGAFEADQFAMKSFNNDSLLMNWIITFDEAKNAHVLKIVAVSRKWAESL